MALVTRSPLMALGIAMCWPTKFCTSTQNRSDKRSVSAIATTLIGFCAVLICAGVLAAGSGLAFLSFDGGGDGGPLGKAVSAGPVMRAAMASFLPDALNSLSSTSICGKPATLSTPTIWLCWVVKTSGVNLVLAPLSGSSTPAVAMLSCEVGGDRAVVIDVVVV